jgi:hypothetical protein
MRAIQPAIRRTQISRQGFGIAADMDSMDPLFPSRSCIILFHKAVFLFIEYDMGDNNPRHHKIKATRFFSLFSHPKSLE